MWNKKGIAWAVENRISDGVGSEALITREQLVVMLYHYVEKPNADVSVLDRYPD